MPATCRIASPSFFSSNVKPYWKPEQPPPWTKMRSGLPSESGIEPAKYLTFSTALSVSVSSGPSAVVIGTGVDDSIVEDITRVSSQEGLWSAYESRCNQRLPGRPGLSQEALRSEGFARSESIE